MQHSPQATNTQAITQQRETHEAFKSWGTFVELKISQVYSNNESKTNLAATRKPLQPHVSSQMGSQGVSAQVRLARLILEVPQTQVSHPAVGAMMQLLPLLSCQTNPAHEALFQLSKEPQAPCHPPSPAASVLQPFSLHHTLP